MENVRHIQYGVKGAPFAGRPTVLCLPVWCGDWCGFYTSTTPRNPIRFTSLSLLVYEYDTGLLVYRFTSLPQFTRVYQVYLVYRLPG
jgi:hypothetical protein